MFKILLLLLTAIDVDVSLLDGTSKKGILTELNDASLTLQIADATETIDLNQVLDVTATADRPATPAAANHQVILHDDSQIACEVTDLTAKQLTTGFLGDSGLSIPRSSVRAIRLHADKPEWRAEWDAYLQRSNDIDLLILLKRDGSGLDFYGGVVSGTKDDTIEFVLDGETIPVKRERIYGIVFPQAQNRRGSGLSVELGDTSRLAARDVRLVDDRLSFTTSWNQTLTVPLAAVTRIDFSSGRFHYLSDLDPVKETYLGTQPEGSLLEDLLGDEDVLGTDAMVLWKLHRDELPMGPYGPQPLTLRGRIYRKGIWLFPKCRIDYALDGKYSSFQGLAGVDDETAFNCVGPNGPSEVKLTILVDGDIAWDQLINAPADPVEIELKVVNAQTLSVLVDFGDDDSACDYLDIVNARLLLVP